MQTDGDCKTATCGGSEADASDAFDDQNDCTVDACDGETPTNEPENIGTTCASDGGKFCDGAKKCVECLMDGDCMSGVCTVDNTCAPAECGDMIENGAETDVDCGGPVCAKCATEKSCVAGTDCQSGVCHPVDKLCSAPSCSDNVKNQNESDVDCGGVCGATCTTGETCAAPGDCADQVCGGMPLTCQAASCMDGVKNGLETDLNCGGPVCPDCVDGKLCSSGADCASGVCNGMPATCQMPTCTDTTKNGTESGVDCGGGSCPACPNDQPCDVNADCQSGFCNAQKICKAPTCTDGAKNGTETDIDCGGTCPNDCMDGQSCATGADCTGGFCLGPSVCASTVNGCTLAMAMDLTGAANPTIAFAGLSYIPPCVKITAGQSVQFSGAFGSHPLQQGAVIGGTAYPEMGPIVATGAGMTATFPFPTPGVFPYYCIFHYPANMMGAVFVVAP